MPETRALKFQLRATLVIEKNNENKSKHVHMFSRDNLAHGVSEFVAIEYNF